MLQGVFMQAAEWIRNNLKASVNLSDDLAAAVSDFALTWAIFEASEGERTNCIPEKLFPLAEKLSHKVSETFVDDLLAYWSIRYVTSASINWRFEHIGFTDVRHSELVKSVLLGIDSFLVNKLTALLLIVYRYRNNLFHGNKDITLLENQTDNLNHSVELLQRVMLESGKFRFLGS